MTFLDRKDAGRQLAKALRGHKGEDAVVLALPRGGIVLAAEVSKELKVPLGLILVRKIGYPGYSEYAIGAVVEDEKPIYNLREIAGLDKSWLQLAESEARELIEKRRTLYYGENSSRTDVIGKLVIIVDDGIATGMTMVASVKAMKNRGAKQIVVAVPVAARESINSLKNLADEIIVLDDPDKFLGAVGAHYREFGQVEDEQVKEILSGVNNGLYQTVA